MEKYRTRGNVVHTHTHTQPIQNREDTFECLFFISCKGGAVE